MSKNNRNLWEISIWNLISSISFLSVLLSWQSHWCESHEFWLPDPKKRENISRRKMDPCRVFEDVKKTVSLQQNVNQVENSVGINLLEKNLLAGGNSCSSMKMWRGARRKNILLEGN